LAPAYRSDRPRSIEPASAKGPAAKPDAPEYARYLDWLNFAEGSLMSLVPVAFQ
jgi:hypothetical protein